MIHWITETSPLFGATPASLAASEVEIIVSVVGLDETLSQTVHARHSFIPEEIVVGSALRRRHLAAARRPAPGRPDRTSTRSWTIRSTLPPWLTGGGTAA